MRIRGEICVFFFYFAIAKSVHLWYNITSCTKGRIINMEKYENYFEMTESLYVEVIKKMIPAARYIMYTAAVILLGVSAGIMIIGKNILMGVLWLILAAILFFSGYIGIPMKAKKIYRAHLPGLAGKDGILWKKTIFNNEDFTVTEPNNSATFKYSDIAGVNESKNLYIFILRESKKLLFVKKDCFKNATNGEFIDFLMIKCNSK